MFKTIITLILCFRETSGTAFSQNSKMDDTTIYCLWLRTYKYTYKHTNKYYGDYSVILRVSARNRVSVIASLISMSRTGRITIILLYIVPSVFADIQYDTISVF